MCSTVNRQSRDHRPLSRDHQPLSRDPSVSFQKKFPNCLKRPKTLFDSQPTVAWPPITVAWPFSDFFQNFPKSLETSKITLFDSQPTVAWPPTTVAWPFSDFFQNFPKLLETFKKRCLTVGRRSRDLRPLSRDLSATFFKFFSNCLKRPKIVVWQSADSRVTSTTVAWPFSDFFSKFSQIAWNVQKTLFDSLIDWLIDEIHSFDMNPQRC